MRKKIISLFALFSMLMGTGAQAQDYYVAHGANVNVSHGTHYPNAVSIVGTQSPEQVLNGIASAPRCQAYFDKTNTTFEVLASSQLQRRFTLLFSSFSSFVSMISIAAKGAPR